MISTASNAADGSVVFEPITFDEAGEYEYVVYEVAGREEGMTYDSTTYRLQVSVTDDGQGNLVATANYPDGQPTFANSYEKPQEPVEPTKPSEPTQPSEPTEPAKPDIPKTGDATGPMAAVSAVMGALALTGAGVLVGAKRRQHGEAGSTKGL